MLIGAAMMGNQGCDVVQSQRERDKLAKAPLAHSAETWLQPAIHVNLADAKAEQNMRLSTIACRSTTCGVKPLSPGGRGGGGA